MSYSKKIIRNTLFNAIGRFWTIIVAIILTPYIVSKIGLSAFGIWSLVGVLTGYFGLLDFGIVDSFVKFIAEFYAKKENNKINRLVSTGFFLFLLLSAVSIVLLLIILKPIVVLLNIPAAMQDDATFVFFIGVALFSIVNAFGVFRALLLGLQRMDLSNALGIIISIPTIIGTVFFLESGYGLKGLILNNVIVSVIATILTILCCYRVLPSLKLSLSFFDKKILKKIFSFGIYLQATKLNYLFTFQFDKIIISSILGLGFVSYFEVGLNIVQAAWFIPITLVSAIVPLASELNALKDNKRIVDLYYRTSKFVALFGMPVFFFIMFNSALILQAWLGPGFENAAIVTSAFSLYFLTALFSAAASPIIIGMGKPEIQMRASFLQSILNILFATTAAFFFGFNGLVIASFVAFTLGLAYFTIHANSHLKIPLFSFLKKTFSKPFLACLFSLLCIAPITLFVPIQAQRITSAAFLLAETLLFFTVYAISILVFRYLDHSDFLILSKIPIIKKVIKLDGKN